MLLAEPFSGIVRRRLVRIKRDQNGRLAEKLGYFRCDNTDHALVPMIARQNNNALIVNIVLLLDLPQRLLKDAVFRLLTLFICDAKLFGNHARITG